MKVLYFNNCWFTNVGEAFIDIGGMELAKRIFAGIEDNVKIGCLSAMSDYYIKNAPPMGTRQFWNRKINKVGINSFKISDYLIADYVILPGMVGTLEYLNAPSRRMVDTLLQKGCRPIFLGLGGKDYNKEETEALRKYFAEIKPALITTRDDETYERYKDIAPCVRAVDCAFWSIDAFDPRGLVEEKYDAITFNRIEEPIEFQLRNENVVRPFHMQYIYRREFYKDTMMISDTPYDYLTIYANANKVYTDLVHATIVSMMYGTPVKYWKTDKRCQAFFALDGLKNEDNWYSVPEEMLSAQKEYIVKQAQAILKG